jgi:hypothetical protein
LKIGEVLMTSGRQRRCDDVQLDEVVSETSFSASIASRRWREARLDLQVRQVYVGLAVLLQNKARKRG